MVLSGVGKVWQSGNNPSFPPLRPDGQEPRLHGLQEASKDEILCHPRFS